MKKENKNNAVINSAFFIPSPLGERVGNAPVRGVQQSATFLSPSSVCAGCALQTPSPRLGRRNYTGFTLIELLVVVLIIGILSAIALPQYNVAVEKSRVAEAMTNAASLQKAIDVWLLENGYPTGNSSFCFLGDDCGGKGQLAVDLESGMDCSQISGKRCASKNFAYGASCDKSQQCRIWIGRFDNTWLYDIGWAKSSTEGWHAYECDYYPAVSPIGEKICKHLETQGFEPCEDC